MKIDQADVIKFGAIATATPRWVGALLAAEGITVQASWGWWLPMSITANIGMAIVEGLAFAYVFNAWRRTSGKPARNLLILALASAATFVGVIAPFVASRVRSVPLSEILSNGLALFAWSIAVAASTIAIVASVGYAQKAPQPERTRSQPSATSEPTTAQAEYPAVCPVDGCEWSKTYPDATSAQNALNAHSRIHRNGYEVKEPIEIEQ